MCLVLYRVFFQKAGKVIIKIISLLFCVVLAVSLCACNNISVREKTLSFENSNTVGNSLDNIDKGGYLASQDDYLFYYLESSAAGLYCSKTDGTEKQKLAEGNISCINVVDDKIYYVKDEYVSNPSEQIENLHTFNLYSMDLNSKIETQLIENCGHAYVDTNCIYYLFTIDMIEYRNRNLFIPENQTYLYRYDIKTSNSELLVPEKVVSYRIVNDKIYYMTSEQEAIYSISANPDQKSPDVVYQPEYDPFKDESFIAYFTNRTNDELIISDGANLISFNLKTLKKETLAQRFNTTDFVLADKDLYFIENLESVNKMNLDSKERETLFLIEDAGSMTTHLYYCDNGCYYSNGKDMPKHLS